MAETVTPSVRGRQRWNAEAALLAGAAATAAIAGFAFGLIGEVLVATVGGLGDLVDDSSSSSGADPMVIVWIAVAGLGLDASRLLTGRPRPLTLGRQVPREWGRLLPLPVTAFLYGGRLGVGPLTILSTWMWWAALIAAALVGVWVAVAVSVSFAVSRVVINGLVGRRLARRPESNLAAVRSFQQRGWSGLTGLAAVLIVATAFLAGCGVAGDPAARPVLLGPSDDNAATATAMTPEALAAEAVASVGDTPPPTSPAQLEDFVRTSTLHSDIPPSTSAAGAQPAIEPAVVAVTADPAERIALAELAPTSLSGMVVIDDSDVDRYLTIDEAAAIQPDPTEEIALLETRGYRGGWIRAFRSPASDVAVAAVYEFADAAEAEFYLEDGLITIGGYGGQFFDVAELPDIRGFQQDVVDDGETVRTLGGAFHRDNRWFLLYVVGSPETVTPDVLIPALRSWRNDLGL